MRRRSSVQVGPGAASLILMFVMLAMSVLGILSLHESVSDAGLGRRAIQVAEQTAALQVRAEKTRARLAAWIGEAQAEGAQLRAYLARRAADEGTPLTIEDETVSWIETDGTRTLACAVRLAGEEDAGAPAWISYRLETAGARADEEAATEDPGLAGPVEGTGTWNW